MKELPNCIFTFRCISWLFALTICLFFSSCYSLNEKVEGHSYFSEVLEREIEYMVFLPNNYTEKIAGGKKFPVLYLLHCAGGEPADWQHFSGMRSLINRANFIAVAPYDGTGYSWWIDSPENSKDKFSTFLAGEFKDRINATYATLYGPENSGLAGFSMGGFGALYNVMQHPDEFSIAYGICAGTDILRWPGRWGLDAVLGKQKKSLENWQKVNILSNAAKYKGTHSKIKFYSNENDFFLAENQSLDSLLNHLGIPHEYFESGDAHEYPDTRQMKEIIQYFNKNFAY